MSNQQQPPVELIEFSDDHIDHAVRLSREAGWPHTANDWRLMLSVSSGVVAVRDGEIVGTALRSDFGHVSTLSMIIVDKRTRGMGIGRGLMNHVMASVEEQELRLVATPEGMPLYEKLGFVVTGEISRYQGTAKSAVPELSVVMVEDVDLNALERMDFRASGMQRGSLLPGILSMGNVFQANGGFALLRPFGLGYVLGPLVAKDETVARSLIAAAASSVESSYLRLDTPVAQAQHDFIEALGLMYVENAVAMALRPRPRNPSDYRVFAVASQALG